jgi:hypothetical protein
MSCLYSSPKVTSVGFSSSLFALLDIARAKRAEISPRIPLRSSNHGCSKSFRLPNQAQVSRVSFQAQYQAFVRFAVGSSAAFLSHRAQMDLRFGTFHSGRVLALRTLASTRNFCGVSTGASNPRPML